MRQTDSVYLRFRYRYVISTCNHFYYKINSRIFSNPYRYAVYLRYFKKNDFIKIIVKVISKNILRTIIKLNYANLFLLEIKRNDFLHLNTIRKASAKFCHELETFIGTMYSTRIIQQEKEEHSIVTYWVRANRQELILVNAR